jgi:ornithine carbamoyltransferase
MAASAVPIQPLVTVPAPTPKELLGKYKTIRDLAGGDLLTFASLTKPVVESLFATARDLKAKFRTTRPHLSSPSSLTPHALPLSSSSSPTPHASPLAPSSLPLSGTTSVLLFEKASLRTKMSFETGIGFLGGRALFMDHSNQKLGEREAVKDYAKNLERWVDCIIARVYSQEVLYELAEHARVPVINALSDRFHPCQALADLFTLSELAAARNIPLSQLRLAYVGDGNNVCHSLMHASTMLGVSTTVISPKGYEPASDVIEECEALCKSSGATLTISNDLAAVERHHAVYTDVWVSMGQADTAAKRRKVFAPYQVNASLMTQAAKGLPPVQIPQGPHFMHCLPAQRGVEVTDEVIDAPASLVYEQAENRMHAQNALLAHMFLKP